MSHQLPPGYELGEYVHVVETATPPGGRKETVEIGNMKINLDLPGGIPAGHSITLQVPVKKKNNSSKSQLRVFEPEGPERCVEPEGPEPKYTEAEKSFKKFEDRIGRYKHEAELKAMQKRNEEAQKRRRRIFKLMMKDRKEATQSAATVKAQEAYKRAIEGSANFGLDFAYQGMEGLEMDIQEVVESKKPDISRSASTSSSNAYAMISEVQRLESKELKSFEESIATLYAKIKNIQEKILIASSFEEYQEAHNLSEEKKSLEKTLRQMKVEILRGYKHAEEMKVYNREVTTRVKEDLRKNDTTKNAYGKTEEIARISKESKEDLKLEPSAKPTSTKNVYGEFAEIIPVKEKKKADNKMENETVKSEVIGNIYGQTAEVDPINRENDASKMQKATENAYGQAAEILPVSSEKSKEAKDNVYNELVEAEVLENIETKESDLQTKSQITAPYEAPPDQAEKDGGDSVEATTFEEQSILQRDNSKRSTENSSRMDVSSQNDSSSQMDVSQKEKILKTARKVELLASSIAMGMYRIGTVNGEKFLLPLPFMKDPFIRFGERVVSDVANVCSLTTLREYLAKKARGEVQTDVTIPQVIEFKLPEVMKHMSKMELKADIDPSRTWFGRQLATYPSRPVNQQLQEIQDSTMGTKLRQQNQAREYSALKSYIVKFVSENIQNIIIEVHLPPILRQFPYPLRVGGLAGGKKYHINGMLVKFALNSNGIYAGDDEAAKVAKNEFRHHGVIKNESITSLFLPEVVLYNMCGFTVVATSIAPIEGDKSLVYGSPDAGKTIRNSKNIFEPFAKQLAEKFHLKKHPVMPTKHEGKEKKAVDLWMAADIEAHLSGVDGRLYLLDVARFLPAQPPRKGAKADHLVRLFRPEFMQAYTEKQISADVFSGFGKINSRENAIEAHRAYNTLCLLCVPRAAKDIVNNLNDIRSGRISIASILHARGVNIRLSGLVYVHLVRSEHSEYNTEAALIILRDMVHRVIKKHVRRCLRTAGARVSQVLFSKEHKEWAKIVKEGKGSLYDIARKYGKRKEEYPARDIKEYKHLLGFEQRLVVDIFARMVFGDGPTSDAYWSEILVGSIQAKFDLGRQGCTVSTEELKAALTILRLEFDDDDIASFINAAGVRELGKFSGSDVTIEHIKNIRSFKLPHDQVLKGRKSVPKTIPPAESRDILRFQAEILKAKDTLGGTTHINLSIIMPPDSSQITNTLTANDLLNRLKLQSAILPTLSPHIIATMRQLLQKYRQVLENPIGKPPVPTDLDAASKSAEAPKLSDIFDDYFGEIDASTASKISMKEENSESAMKLLSSMLKPLTEDEIKTAIKRNSGFWKSDTPMEDRIKYIKKFTCFLDKKTWSKSFVHAKLPRNPPGNHAKIVIKLIQVAHYLLRALEKEEDTKIFERELTLRNCLMDLCQVLYFAKCDWGCVCVGLALLRREMLSEYGDICEWAKAMNGAASGTDRLHALNEKIVLLETSIDIMEYERKMHGPYEAYDITLSAKHNLSLAYAQMGKNDKAIEIVRSGLKEIEKIPQEAIDAENAGILREEKKMGFSLEDHLSHFNVSLMHRLANLHGMKGDWKEKVRILRFVKEETGRVYGENHSTYGALLNDLGEALLASGIYNEAKRYLEASVDVGRKNGQVNLDHLQNLSKYYRSSGNWAKVLSLGDEYVKWAKIRGDPLTVAEALREKARTLGQLNRFEEEFKIIKEAIGIYKKFGIKQGHSYASSLEAFGVAWMNRGLAQGGYNYETGKANNVGDSIECLQKGRKYLEEAVAVQMNIEGARPTDVICIKQNLGIVLGYLGHNEEKIGLCKEGLKVYIATLGTEESTHIADLYANMGQTYITMKKYKEAEEVLQKAYNFYCKAFGPYHQSAKWIKRRLERIVAFKTGQEDPTPTSGGIPPQIRVALAQIKEMGIQADDETIIQAIVAAQGDVNTAVAMLFSMQ